MHAADGFLPRARGLAGPPPSEPADGAPPPASEPDPPAPPPVAPAAVPPEAAVLRDVRLFRARLADALDAAVPLLLREIAAAVVGRELCLAPADVAALTARVLAEHPACAPVAVRHAPGDRVPPDIPAIADPALAPGDVVIAFAGGGVDARLGVRLAVVLEAWA